MRHIMWALGLAVLFTAPEASLGEETPELRGKGPGEIEAKARGKGGKVRLAPAIRVRFTDRDFRDIDGAVLYVVYPGGPGTGEVWIEVAVPTGHPGFDDGRVEEVSVKVTSTSDDAGVTALCTETAADSRRFRSRVPVLLRSAAFEGDDEEGVAVAGGDELLGQLLPPAGAVRP